MGGHRRGLAVLVAKGMVAFLAVAAALAPLLPRPAAVSAVTPSDPTGGLEQQIVAVWARMVLAHPP